MKNKDMNDKTIVIGRLNEDPELVNGECKFVLRNTAINSCGVQDTILINCVASHKHSENVMKYLHEGDLCCIEGNIKKYDERLGGYQNRPVNVDRLVFLTPKDKRGCIYPN